MKLIASITVILNKAKHDNVSAFAAEAALFVIMSFVPVILLLLTLIKFTPLTEATLLTLVNDFLPDAFKVSISTLIHGLYNEVSTTVMLVTIFSILWAAGKGFVSLIDGLNSVFLINERRNWFIIRLYSILYTIVFVIIILVCLVIYVLGNLIYSLTLTNVPFVARIIEVILNFRALIVIALLSILFTFLYVAIPNRRTKIKRQLPGGLFSAVGWMGFSYFFSIYVNYSKNLSIVYGSLATIVCAMLWLYVCMYIFLLGGEINFYVEQWTAGQKIKAADDITHHHKHS